MTGTTPSDGDRYDVIVVGAGASGLWGAVELATDRDVLVLEAGDVGGGASGRAAGFVSLFADWAPFPAAVTHAIDGFRTLDGQHGFEFVERPYVELAETEAEANSLREAHRPMIEHAGYDVGYLEAAALERRWPGRLDLSGFAGGLVKAEGGIVDPGEYVHAVAATARDRGVEIRTQTPVRRIGTENGAVTGVEVDDGRIAADNVVCAAGARTAGLVEEFVDLPTRQFVYSNARVRTDAELGDDYPMLYGRDVWWRPEPRLPRTLVISGGMYFLPEPNRPPRSPPTEYVREVEERLPEMARDVDTVRFVTGSHHTCSTGTSITPDALPILDAPESAPDDLVIATAVTAGVSMSPFTGAAIRSLVTGEEAPVSMEPFALGRFDSPPEDFQVHEIREMPSEFTAGEY